MTKERPECFEPSEEDARYTEPIPTIGDVLEAIEPVADIHSLSPFEQWMVRSNIASAEEFGFEEIVAGLRANGYERVANAVEAERLYRLGGAGFVAERPYQSDPCTHRDNPDLCRKLGWAKYEKLEGERDFNDV